MKYKNAIFNGVAVTCRDDGKVSWERQDGSSNRHETFGSNSNGYRACHINHKVAKVHRLIAMAFLDDYDDSLQVDHINGDKSDNRPENLRMATPLSNSRAHRKKRVGASSQYRGVKSASKGKPWIAEVTVCGKSKSCGSYDDEKKAALARDIRARRSGFPIEGLNFPWIFNIQPV